MAKPKKKRRRKSRPRSGGIGSDSPRCGLCGNTEKLTKTECCGNWICDDEGQYELFSYARNSCYRNHRRFTLCGHHHDEEHSGNWKDCPQCKKDANAEMYAHFGTNEYNFEKLENPPDYEPTRCTTCNVVIPLSEGGYSMTGGEYFCGKCKPLNLPSFLQ